LANDKGQKVYMAIGYIVPHIMSICVLAAVITRATLNAKIDSAMPSLLDGLATGDTESSPASFRKASEASVGMDKEDSGQVSGSCCLPTLCDVADYQPPQDTQDRLV
jgi:hypothetical protein